MIKNLSSNQRFVIYTVLIGAIITISSLLISSLLTAVFISILLCALIYILRPLVMPAGYGQNKIRMLSLVGAFAIAGTWSLWGEIIDSAIKIFASTPTAQTYLPGLKNVTIDKQPSIAALIFIFLCILVVNYFMRDKSIASDHPDSIDLDFPEEDFKKKLKSFCSNLDKHLIQIDRESNWSPEYYTELQAEVEILTDYGRTENKRITNLQQAIKSDRRTQAFLILGTPGAGKSVALRKLARDMLDEASSTNRIPIYINLREWHSAPTDSNGETPLTMGGLENFITNNLKDRGDLFTERFVDKYFRNLWRSGYLFFIFDSFDEVPELLDADEHSEVINDLSKIIHRFISSSPNSRGVLASRIFRRPTASFQTQKELEIRPLSDHNIAEALDRFPHFSEEIKSALFNRRGDLIPIVRNPFLMTLLGEWISENHNLPQTQSDIYEFYLKKRLKECENRIINNNLTIDEVLAITKQIAWFVFSEPTLGLEAPVSNLSRDIDSENVGPVIDILYRARIARVTSGSEKSFAFVHRRFLEYFVTKCLLDNPDSAPIEHIPTDSRGRDALVLYAQLCAPLEAERLLDICWEEVTLNFEKSSTRLRAIHCLRFIIEAFYSRRDVVSKIIHPLEEFIANHTGNGDDIILAKICLEGTGLIPEKKSVPILYKAIQVNDSWLQETAFRACRNLPRLEEGLVKGLNNYIEEIPTTEFWKNRNTLFLSLSLSDSMKEVYRRVKARTLNLKLSAAAVLGTAILAPNLIAASALMTLILTLMTLSFITLSPFKNAFKALTLKFPTAHKPWDLALAIFRYALPFLIVSHILTKHTNINYLIKQSSEDLALQAKIKSLLPTSLNKFNSFTEQGLQYFWGVADIPHYLSITLLTILAALIIDWLLTSSVIRSIVGMSRDIKNIKSGLTTALSLAAIFSLFIILFNYLEKIEIFQKVMIIVVPTFGLIVTLYLVASTTRYFLLHFKDSSAINKVYFHETILRSEIVEFLEKLRTSHGRLTYIRKLEQKRIFAVGDWPASFKLSVGGDASISALARLEEKWLKLD